MRIPCLKVFAACSALLQLAGCSVVPLIESSHNSKTNRPAQPPIMSKPALPAPHTPAPATPPPEPQRPSPHPPPASPGTQAPSQSTLPRTAPSAPAPVPTQPPVPLKQPEPGADPSETLQSLATDPLSYRMDAARHLYRRYAQRIYKGKLPPLLKSVCVVEVLVGPGGQVLDIVWSRPPRHADVRREIEGMIAKAGPFPAPVKLRKVTYTETWLWHASGDFQLDTLTEGQI